MKDCACSARLPGPPAREHDPSCPLAPRVAQGAFRADLRRSSREIDATHTLTVEVPLALVDHRLIDGTVIKDTVHAILSIARIAGQVGNAQVTLTEIEERP